MRLRGGLQGIEHPQRGWLTSCFSGWICMFISLPWSGAQPMDQLENKLIQTGILNAWAEIRHLSGEEWWGEA